MGSIAAVAPKRAHAARAPAPRPSRPHTAFVFSGGASLGALQVGMLQALYEHGIVADVLVGTSVGAFNAAFVASRPQTPATAADLARVWRGLQREDLFPVSLRTLVSGLAGQRDHLVPDRGLRSQVARYIEFEDLSEATVPLHLVAYDLIEGDEVLLSDGRALDAITAAASIPGIFPPVTIGERCLIDGGVVNNTPISHAVALGAERIYVLRTQQGWNRLGRAPRGALDAAIYALGLLVDGRLEADIARYSDGAELIVIPAPNPRRVQPTDFEHSSHLIGQAHASCRALLARSHGGRSRLRASGDGLPSGRGREAH